jgi:hypothetical protein
MCNECQDKYSMQFQCFPKLPAQPAGGSNAVMGGVNGNVFPSNLAQLLAPDLLGNGSVLDEGSDVY